MTNEERNDFVSGNFLYCIKDVDTIRKGSGCNQGNKYWFEYIPDGNFYRKLSDNNHYDEVYITDDELLNNFWTENDYKCAMLDCPTCVNFNTKCKPSKGIFICDILPRLKS